MSMTFSEVYQGLKFLEHLQEELKAAEFDDRNYIKYLKEQEQDYSHVQSRVDQYMIQRGTISETIDIIDGLKVRA